MPMSSSSDLLDHFKLDATVFGDYTLHTSYEPDHARGRRKKKVEKKWCRTEHIGSGSFGEVWLEAEEGTPNQRAVKVLKKASMNTWKIDYRRELTALAKFSKSQHQQEEVFVMFLGWFENAENVFLAMEYFPDGDLNKYIADDITENDAVQITIDVLEGLKIMHAEGFAHRDLKPQNIFVVMKPPNGQRWWVKIGDFGISKRTSVEQTALRTMIGTPQFQAPEIIGFIEEESSEYSEAVDMWSLGCVVYQLIARRVPFPDNPSLNRFCQGRMAFPERALSANLSAVGIEFIKSLLKPQASQRWTAEDALKSPWLESSRETLDSANQLLSAARPRTKKRDPDLAEALYRAAADGHEAVVRLLLEEGVDPELQNSDGLMPLCEAANNGHEAVVSLLLEKGIDPDPKTRDGRTPLFCAAYNGHEAVVRLLLEGVDLNPENPDGRTMMRQAAYDRQEGVVRLLKKKRLDPSFNDRRGETPLFWAVYNRHEAVVRLLLKGVDPYLSGPENLTPMCEASYNGPEMVARMLLEGVVNPYAEDPDGWIALFWAAYHGRKRTVSLLLKNGVDPDPKNRWNEAPLFWAANNGHEAVVSLLLEKGVDPDPKNSDGRTPLRQAAFNGQEGIVKLLLKKGANPVSRDRWGETPQFWAAYKGHVAVAKLLQNKSDKRKRWFWPG